MPRTWRDRLILLAIAVFGVVMLAIQVYTFFGPPPASDRSIAWTALVSYAAFAIVIWWLQDRPATMPP